MLTVQFVDHSEAVKELLSRKLLAAVGAAAQILSDGYQGGLQATIAPKHSKVGAIPHAYMGHKPGGFGPLNQPGQPNNTPQQGFSSTQTEFLSEYIDHGSTDLFGDVSGFVGFKPGHVTTRSQNYLLWHDAHGRPWVIRLYDKNKQAMATSAQQAFQQAK